MFYTTMSANVEKLRIKKQIVAMNEKTGICLVQTFFQ